MCWTAGSQDGNEFQLEKIGPVFSSLSQLPKTQIMDYFHFENSFDVFLSVFFKHFVYNKGI